MNISKRHQCSDNSMWLPCMRPANNFLLKKTTSHTQYSQFHPTVCKFANAQLLYPVTHRMLNCTCYMPRTCNMLHGMMVLVAHATTTTTTTAGEHYNNNSNSNNNQWDKFHWPVHSEHCTWSPAHLSPLSMPTAFPQRDSALRPTFGSPLGDHSLTEPPWRRESSSALLRKDSWWLSHALGQVFLLGCRLCLLRCSPLHHAVPRPLVSEKRKWKLIVSFQTSPGLSYFYYV